MRRQYDDDLFKDSTMTFGEHLEELRKCLFRAVVGLVIGFLFGLLIGNKVVAIIQQPLNNALVNYYKAQWQREIETKLEAYRQAGFDLPDDPAEVKKFLDSHPLGELTFEEVYVNSVEIWRQLAKAYPGHFDEPAAALKPSDTTGEGGHLMLLHLGRRSTDDRRTRAQSLGIHEAFAIWVKASLLVGAVLASPWIFYQIWSFVAAGLYPHEKYYVRFYLPVSLGLFLAGAALAFLFVFEPVLTFLFSFNDWLGIDPDPRISEWLSFVLILPLGFGIAFQLPLVMLFLQRIGIFSVEAYLSYWRMAILVIFVISMFLTPADPYSMLLMAVPLTVLYFGGVLLCKWMPRNRSPFSALDE